MTSPSVTVLMAVYNGERYLREAIESILQQTWRDFEFLIVDDGSTDATASILSSYRDERIRILHNDVNLGLTKSLNRGLRAARGELVARQDADDVSFPERLERQVARFRADPELALLGTQAVIVDEKSDEIPYSRWVYPRSWVAVRWALMFDNPLFHTSVMFRRHIVRDQLEGYDEAFQRSQDYDLWSRVAYHYKVENLSERLVAHRAHPVSLTRQDGRLNALNSERIIHRNLRFFLETDEIPEDWASLLQRLRLDVWEDASVHALERLQDVLQWVFSRYCELHPGARRDKDVQRHVALQYLRLAGFSKKWRSKIRWSAYTWAIKLSPMVVLKRGYASASIRYQHWRLA